MNKLNKLLLVGIIAIFPVFASAYTDEGMSRSMQLQLMERSYDLGRTAGESLTRDQVVTLQATSNSLYESAGSLHNSNVELRNEVVGLNNSNAVLGRKAEDIEASNRAMVMASERTALESQRALQESRNVAIRSGQLATDEGEIRENLKKIDSAINQRLSQFDHRLDKKDLVDQGMLQKTNILLASAEDVSNLQIALAEKQSGEVVLRAEKEAAEIIKTAKIAVQDNVTNYERVMHERVTCNLKDAFVKDVLNCLSPVGWKINIETENDDFNNSLISYTSDKPRRDAINEFIEKVKYQTNSEVELNVGFYPRLLDKQGNPAPTIIFSDEER